MSVYGRKGTIKTYKGVSGVPVQRILHPTSRGKGQDERRERERDRRKKKK